jgi:hypothetical protein
MAVSFNKKAYNVLREEEKASLSLKKLHGKSTWQAGEILKKSHYKYLEIEIRAEKYFSLFTQHYNLYNTLIPEGLNLNEDFKKYITLAIEKRLKIKEIIPLIPNSVYQKTNTREPLITQGINDLKNSKSLNAQNLYNVIMDFDRYNNFRVLPKNVQEPSAFKRRNKKRFNAHLKISVTLHPYTLHRIKELFEQNSNNLKNEGYMVLANFPHVKEIIRVNTCQENMDRFSRISLYVFPTREKAKEYMDLVFDYFEDNNVKKGLKFWPNFRNIIKESLNYDLINNIHPNRKSLHDALFDMDVSQKMKKNKADFKHSFIKPE